MKKSMHEPFDNTSIITHDVVCGMTVNPEDGVPAHKHNGCIYHFCRKKCHDKFIKNPDAYSKARDPVCGMIVNPGITHHMSRHVGERFYFCSARCKNQFDTEPKHFLRERPEPKPMPKNTLYTCPMDPEIISDKPQDCPVCGMALSPATPSINAEPNPELIDFRRRLWIGAPLAAVIFTLEMGTHIGMPFDEWIGIRTFIWIQFLLATIVIWCTKIFFKRGWSSIINHSPNMWTLIMIGTGSAYIFSVVSMIAPDIFPNSVREMNGLPPVYFEATSVILILVLIGQIMELTSREKTGDAIRSLMNLAPKKAWRITKDGEEHVSLDEVMTGDILKVLPGESIPVDGVVIKGQSYIDESMITGEPIPVEKSANDAVTGGTLNKAGSFTMEAKAVGQDTLLSRIVTLVAQAQRSRAPIQAQADRWAGYFVPTVMTISLLTFIVWMLIGPPPAISYAIIAAISVLIIACPCALGLVTPMSIMVATGRGAKAGVLIRDAETLELLSDVSVLIIDKTGTLTDGTPSITEIIPLGKNDLLRILSLAAALERNSEHPLAEAIIANADKSSAPKIEITNFEAVVGKGIRGRVEGTRIALGNLALMHDLLLSLDEPAVKQMEVLQLEGKTAMLLACDEEIIGIIAVEDSIKQMTPTAISSLLNEGLKIVMATGDNHRTAEFVARKLGISEVYAELSPQDKSDLVAKYKAKGLTVAMIGDGVNDAPALALADVSIAMGTGSDVAVETASITLIQGDLTGIVRARRLANATMRNIRQNLAFAFIYNAAGIPIAAGVLYPLLGVLLSPMIAATAMSLSSVSIIWNALRLRNVRISDT